MSCPWGPLHILYLGEHIARCSLDWKHCLSHSRCSAESCTWFKFELQKPKECLHHLPSRLPSAHGLMAELSFQTWPALKQSSRVSKFSAMTQNQEKGVCSVHPCGIWSMWADGLVPFVSDDDCAIWFINIKLFDYTWHVCWAGINFTRLQPLQEEYKTFGHCKVSSNRQWGSALIPDSSLQLPRFREY